jgi:predicted DNA-binding ribbon-helix-helix protein
MMKKTEKETEKPVPEQILVERVQTGIRLEKRLLKVLKGLAEYHDMYLGDLLEGIVLHAFDGKSPFGEESLARIADLKRIYGLDLDASASHRLIEKEEKLQASALSKRAKRRSQK